MVFFTPNRRRVFTFYLSNGGTCPKIGLERSLNTMSDQYDYILAGGGAAGLSLAYHMVRNGISDKTIAIVDVAEKSEDGRTWCFWTDRPFLFDPIVYRRWRYIWFHGPERSHRLTTHPYEYRMVRGEDFYRYTRSDLTQRTNVAFIRDRVSSIEDGEEYATVHLESGRELSGSYVFDSTFRPEDFDGDVGGYRFLKRRFVGWIVETDDPVFDPDAATMFDLRLDQDRTYRFRYILPFSEKNALVEYTFVSPTLLDRGEYEAGIREYLGERLGVSSFRIVGAEDGVIPMTDQPIPCRDGKRVLRIGTKGGRVKASTGFAFLRIQRDSERIVESILSEGRPRPLAPPSRRYAIYDAMLLSILDRLPDKGRSIFVDLFEKNPLTRVFRFLDEEDSLWENLRLVASVPWSILIVAWFDVRIRRPRLGR